MRIRTPRIFRSYCFGSCRGVNRTAHVPMPRSLESMWRSGQLSGETDLFIYPGFAFRRVNAMLTNFHLSRTSLLLVCAFAGRELALAAFRHAVAERYRFYWYGNCTLMVWQAASRTARLPAVAASISWARWSQVQASRGRRSPSAASLKPT